MERASLKRRRRSWLGIGFAGCSMLTTPAQAAWPSFGTVWRSLPSTTATAATAARRHHHHHPLEPSQSQRNSINHGDQHGTLAGAITRRRETTKIPSLRGGIATATAVAASSPPRWRRAGDDDSSAASNAADAGKNIRRILLPSRVLKEVEISLHGVYGDWEACQPETCTQSRQVLCETRESRIVANELCGDELPVAEQACKEADAAVCVDAGGGGATAAREGETPGIDNKHGEGSKSKGNAEPAGVGSSDSTPSTTKKSSDAKVEKDASTGHAASPRSAASNPSYNSNLRHGTATAPGDAASNVNVGKDTSSPNWIHQGVKAIEPTATADTATKTTTTTTTPKTTGPKESTAALADGGGEEGVGDSEEKDVGVGAGTTAVAAAPATAGKKNYAGDNSSVGGEQPRGSASSKDEQGEGASLKRSPAAGTTGSTTGSPPEQQDETRTGKPPNLAKVQAPLKMDQLGGSRFGPGRAEYRLWTVLAIGAGAVGSFMAVVVFAVGQYRKERHRLRGIMALNEFPQDNYINPFARQLSSDLSDDERSAFKL